MIIIILVFTLLSSTFSAISSIYAGYNAKNLVEFIIPLIIGIISGYFMYLCMFIIFNNDHINAIFISFLRPMFGILFVILGIMNIGNVLNSREYELKTLYLLHKIAILESELNVEKEIVQ